MATADQEERHRSPGFNRQHVGLPVEEQRKCAALAEVLGHQPDDRLIGIEPDLFEEQIDERAPEREGGRDAEHERSGGQAQADAITTQQRDRSGQRCSRRRDRRDSAAC